MFREALDICVKHLDTLLVTAPRNMVFSSSSSEGGSRSRNSTGILKKHSKILSFSRHFSSTNDSQNDCSGTREGKPLKTCYQEHFLRSMRLVSHSLHEGCVLGLSGIYPPLAPPQKAHSLFFATRRVSLFFHHSQMSGGFTPLALASEVVGNFVFLKQLSMALSNPLLHFIRGGEVLSPEDPSCLLFQGPKCFCSHLGTAATVLLVDKYSPGVSHAHAQGKPIPIFITPYQGYKRQLLYRVGGWRVGGE
jgi:hypothetical protein